ncbi:MAG: hypothetical protein LBJ63_03330 [Prevotellaceae bacterium]|jgi:hypothetical protein|nr:hypothetical protein [Prevotellaceae bacterium]
MEDDINIRFEEMTFIPQKTAVNVEMKEKEYSSLYAELKDKCNPDNFLHPNPYNKEKAYIANDICLKLANAKDNEELQKHLRHRAIVELEIHFNSHALRDKLKIYANPSEYKFTEKFRSANELYTNILENGEDVEALEKIQLVIESVLLDKTISEIEIETEIEREKKRQWRQIENMKQENRKNIALAFCIIGGILIIIVIVSMYG